MDADRMVHHGPDEEGSTHVRLRVYAASIQNGTEYRSLRDAAAAASVEGQVTWLDNSAGAPIAAIVPRGIAELGIRAWEEELRWHQD
jgi:hypothetical protein